MRRLLALLAAAALVLAGCGADDDPQPTEPAASGPPAAKTPVAADQSPAPATRADLVSGRNGFDPRAIFEGTGNGVVTVLSVFEGRRATGTERGLGSGFVIDDNGEIATNAHVVLDEDLDRAEEVYVRFADDNEVRARIVGTDPNSDVALLRVEPKNLDLDPVPLGSSESLPVGTPVAAIGSPFGEERSLSIGVVSGTERTIESLTNFQISDVIQTDAAINHGNSGGPLVDGRGRVVGINSQIQSTGGGGEGVGFAVPVDTVRRVLDELRAKGKVSYGYLGVTTVQVYPQLAQRFDLPAEGAWIQEVRSDSPASKAGVKGGEKQTRFQSERFRTGGDVIVEVSGKAVVEDGDVGRHIAKLGPGEKVELVLRRGGARRTVTVTLGERPDTPNRRIG